MPAYLSGRRASSMTSSQCMLTSGDLARADEKELVGRDRVRLFATEREEARPDHRALLDHHGRRHELHPALDERVDREAQDGHLEERAVADEGVRPLPREAPRPVELDHPERGHELEVVLRREVELARLADAPDLDVVFLALADGHFGPREARHAQHQVLVALLDLAEPRLELLDLRADLPGLFDELRAARPCSALGMPRRELVLARALVLELRRDLAALPIRGEQVVEVEREALVLYGGADLVRVLANELDVEHDEPAGARSLAAPADLVAINRRRLRRSDRPRSDRPRSDRPSVGPASVGAVPPSPAVQTLIGERRGKRDRPHACAGDEHSAASWRRAGSGRWPSPGTARPDRPVRHHDGGAADLPATGTWTRSGTATPPPSRRQLPPLLLLPPPLLRTAAVFRRRIGGGCRSRGAAARAASHRERNRGAARHGPQDHRILHFKNEPPQSLRLASCTGLGPCGCLISVPVVRKTPKVRNLGRRGGVGRAAPTATQEAGCGGRLGERPARRLRRHLGANAVRARPALEHIEALAHLGAHGSELREHLLDPELVLEVHAEIDVRGRAILRRLAVLAHDDERPLERDEDREHQVVEDVRERIEARRIARRRPWSRGRCARRWRGR